MQILPTVIDDAKVVIIEKFTPYSVLHNIDVVFALRRDYPRQINPYSGVDVTQELA